MKNTTPMQKIKSFVIAHKVWSIIIALVILFVGYKIFAGKATAEVHYVTTPATKGTVVVSVSGSGQVSASNQVDLKPKVSGDIISVRVKPGATVVKGQTLFILDSADAGKSVRDARLNLEIAQNDLANAKKDYENTKSSQDISLKNLLLTLNSSVAAVPDNNNTSTNIVTLSGSYTSTIQGKYTLEVYTCQNGVCINYSGLESGSFPIIPNIPQKLGNRGLYVTFTAIPKAPEKWYIDIPSKSSTSYASNLKSYEDAKISVPQAIDAALSTVTSRELAVTQRQNVLDDLDQSLSDFYITAPFSGTIGAVSAQLGGQASAGTALGTIITNQKLASISLNEVDVAKIKLGDKATLTFDAVEGLSIAGEVAEIDSVGTVSQGVVTYSVKIAFDTQDDRIKNAMSVSAAIVTAVAQDVLTVPNSAVKTRNGSSYVELFDAPLPEPTTGTQGSPSSTPPREQPVEVGLSNDSLSEITSGLKEGDEVVSRTITGAVTAATTQAPSLFGSGANRNRASGGNFQMITR